MSEEARDGDAINPLSIATHISQVGATVYVAGKRDAGNPHSDGMPIMRVMIHSDDNIVSDNYFSFPDVIFMVRALSRELRDCAELIEGFGNLHLLLSDKNAAVLDRYFSSASEDLVAAADITRKISRAVAPQTRKARPEAKPKPKAKAG